MDDTINRQMAIEALDRFNVYGYVEEKWEKLRDALQALPSAQPERKTGKWIDESEDGFVECPFCHSATNCDGNIDELHFCFSCGADMRERRQDVQNKT